MTAPTRLGDLIRVVHALQPDDRELAVIGELLADHADAAPVRRPRPPQPTVEDVPPIEAEDRDRRAAPGGRSRRLLRPALRGVRPSARTEPPPWDRAWWVTIGALVALLAGLRSTGLIGGGGWLVLAMVLVVLRPGLDLGARAWSMWWRSAQRHSTREQEDRPEVAAGGAPGAGVTLSRTSWRPPPPGPPLVRPGQERAVAALLAGRAVPGDIDLPATVDLVAARRPVSVIPRRPRWSTSLGLHLHVDVGQALAPFREDVADLRRSLRAIASPHAVVELGFEADPCRVTRPRRIAGFDGGVPMADWLPPSGTPVLVVTDLGIAVPPSGTPAGPGAFVRHHRMVTRAGCPVQYLVPYPSERWPAALRGLPILYWTDDLGAFEVLTALRRRVPAG